MTYPDPPTCYRCGKPAHVDWIDVRKLSDPPGPAWTPGNSWCITPGCVDEHGSRTPFEPTPDELRDRADSAWWKRQRALVEDR